MRGLGFLDGFCADVADSRGILSPYAAVGYYRTGNIGDEIQTVAAMRFFPRRPALIQRERLHRAWHPFRPYKMILNGWFMHRPENWPPSSSIDPLIVSFHLSVDGDNPKRIVPVDHLLTGRNLEWFRRMAGRRPVGARDNHTLSALHAAGVDACFSGCLTLTLERPTGIRPSGEILAVDLGEPGLHALRQRMKERFEVVSHRLDYKRLRGRNHIGLAGDLLRRYASAGAVVTSRLHVALPCLAFGTPVLFVHHNLDDPRFGGLIEHLHRGSLDDFLRNRIDYDLRDPPPNPDTWRPIARELSRRCEEFIAAG